MSNLVFKVIAIGPEVNEDTKPFQFAKGKEDGATQCTFFEKYKEPIAAELKQGKGGLKPEAKSFKDNFNIGDVVKSKVSVPGTHTYGQVVGYDELTGRIIVTTASCLKNGSRTRYSYKPNELENVNKIYAGLIAQYKSELEYIEDERANIHQYIKLDSAKKCALAALNQHQENVYKRIKELQMEPGNFLK